MLVLDSPPELSEHGIITPLSLPPGVGFGLEPRRSRRLARAKVHPTFGSRPERQRQLDARQEAEVRARVARIPLPPRFTLDQIIDHFREVDELKWHKDLRRKIDEQSLQLEEIWHAEEDRGVDSRLVPEGVATFRREARAVSRRLELLNQQRARQFQWVMECSLRGAVTASLASDLCASYLWEFLQTAAVDKVVLTAGLARAEKASSRRALDEVVREVRREIQRYGFAGDEVMRARESLTLMFDLWSSTSISEVSMTKAWTSSAMEAPGVGELREAMVARMGSLRAALLEEFGIDALDRAAPLDDRQVPFARELFHAVVPEAREWVPLS